jgi:hypothetical protein
MLERPFYRNARTALPVIKQVQPMKAVPKSWIPAFGLGWNRPNCAFADMADKAVADLDNGRQIVHRSAWQAQAIRVENWPALVADRASEAEPGSFPAVNYRSLGSGTGIVGKDSYSV